MCVLFSSSCDLYTRLRVSGLWLSEMSKTLELKMQEEHVKKVFVMLTTSKIDIKSTLLSIAQFLQASCSF